MSSVGVTYQTINPVVPRAPLSLRAAIRVWHQEFQQTADTYAREQTAGFARAMRTTWEQACVASAVKLTTVPDRLLGGASDAPGLIEMYVADPLKTVGGLSGSVGGCALGLMLGVATTGTFFRGLANMGHEAWIFSQVRVGAREGEIAGMALTQSLIDTAVACVNVPALSVKIAASSVGAALDYVFPPAAPLHVFRAGQRF